jgi:hypothetical protein
MIFLGPEWNSMMHQEHILSTNPKTNYDQASALFGLALSRHAYFTQQLREGALILQVQSRLFQRRYLVRIDDAQDDRLKTRSHQRAFAVRCRILNSRHLNGFFALWGHIYLWFLTCLLFEYRSGADGGITPHVLGGRYEDTRKDGSKGGISGEHGSAFAH